MGFERSAALQARLHEVIPGGAHTYARGSDQYPEHITPVITRGAGARVWDADGNRYVEYGMGMRSVTLGHGYAPVVEAVREVLAHGLNFSRPTELELAAAEDFLSFVPYADMVKFAKNGSDVTTAAVRLARAATGRDLVAVCADQPFFSTDDWFIGTTPMRAGVPQATRELTVSFRYNDLASVGALFDGYPDRVAAIVMEPATAVLEPAPGFLEGVRALCDRHGAVLVFDEIITGFRWSSGGAQAVYGVRPDLSCWGKAIGNGFPLAALAGRRELMELGGLRTPRERAFLMSTTNGPESVSLAAFRAVAKVYRESDPVAVMRRQGAALKEGVNAMARELGIGYDVAVGDPVCLYYATLDPQGLPSQAFRTLFLQELLKHGVLGQSFVISAAHDDSALADTMEAVHAALLVYRKALEAGSADGFFEGRPVAPAIRAYGAPRQVP